MSEGTEGPGLARWPWLVAAGLLAASAAAAGWSLWLHWLPCRGSMLVGTVLEPFSPRPEFSDSCLRRMDAGLPFPYPPELAEQTPTASELGALAMALAGLAWVVVALGMCWPVRTRVLVAALSLPTLVLAAVCWIAAGDPARDAEAYPSPWWWFSSELLALVALGVGGTTGVGTTTLVRFAVVLGGSTAFGFLHMLFDYVFMGTINSANWDTPPGSGWPLVVLLAVSSAVTVVLALNPQFSWEEESVSDAPSSTQAPRDDPARRSGSRPGP